MVDEGAYDVSRRSPVFSGRNNIESRASARERGIIMETLQAKTRDMSIKAKKLRREGKVTGSISGKNLEHSVSITLDANKVAQFMAHNMVGSKVALNVDGTTYNTIIKSADYDALAHHYIDMTFQQLYADEKIKAQAEIIFTNEDHAKGFLTRNVTKIDYKAFPADIIDRIELDVSQYPIGSSVAVSDLDLAKNPNVEIDTPLDASVLHVAEHQHISAAEEEILEGGETAAEEEPASAE